MSRSPHFARGNLSSIKIAIANWWIPETGTGVETGSGGSATYTASVEFPAGVFTQLKFSGSPSVVAANAATAFSDFASVSIPNGSLFWVRIFAVYTGNNLFYGNNTSFVADTANGQALTFSAGAIPDQTLSGTVVNTDNPADVAWAPLAILGLTTNPSFFLMGDSRIQGFSDTPTINASGDQGEVAPSIGPNFGYVNAGVPTTSIQFWLTGSANQRALIAMLPNMRIINNFGINDIGNAGRTAAQVLADNQSAQALIGKPMYLVTLPPISSSTDGWATTANQTTGGNNSVRLTYNSLVRAVPPWATGIFDITPVLETSLGSGIWKAPGFTADGIHETAAANENVRTSGLVHYP